MHFEIQRAPGVIIILMLFSGHLLECFIVT